jgi:hypothetical protein
MENYTNNDDWLFITDVRHLGVGRITRAHDHRQLNYSAF